MEKLDTRNSREGNEQHFMNYEVVFEKMVLI